jgi:hypothetical protein
MSQQIIPRAINVNSLISSGALFSVNQSEFEQAILGFYAKIIMHREARQKIDAVNTILSEHMLENYVINGFEEKGYLYNELYRIDSHHFEADKVQEFLKLMAICSPAFGISIPVPAMSQPVSAMDLKANKGILDKFFQIMVPHLNTELPFVGSEIWKNLQDIYGDFSERPDLSPTGRFLAIILLRARDHKKSRTIEKGAETPDKSWFSVNIRNASYLGLDKKMLEELNRLAFQMGR